MIVSGGTEKYVSQIPGNPIGIWTKMEENPLFVG
jgi:hypothetical protein